MSQHLIQYHPLQRLDKKILEIRVTALVHMWKRTIVPFCTGQYSANQCPSGGRPSSLQVRPPFCLEEQAGFPGADVVLHVLGQPSVLHKLDMPRYSSAAFG